MSQTITADKPRRIRPTTLAAIGFAAPLIIYMLIFYVWPLIQNISMSMHRYTRRTFVTGDAPWAGFDIYKGILSDQQFWTILGQTLIFVFASIVFQYSIGLALAVFFNQNFKLSAALRGAFLVPWLLPPMISGTIWQWMMDADSGVINNFLKSLHALFASFVTIFKFKKQLTAYNTNRTKVRIHTSSHTSNFLMKL